MQVQVKRVSVMPHNVGLWVDDRPSECLVLMQQDLITEEGAQYLEEALNYSARGCNREAGDEE